MILFFDTETTGVPKNYKAPVHDLDNWPRVIQLAYAVISDDGKEIHEAECNLIRPDGWVIPKEKFWIDNGFSTEKNIREGIHITVALNGLRNAIDFCHTIVAHNMDFDMDSFPDVFLG